LEKLFNLFLIIQKNKINLKKEKIKKNRKK